MNPAGATATAGFVRCAHLLLLTDATAVAAPEDILGCETYCLDYEEHIPISLFNDSMLVNNFRVIAVNGEKVLKITADELLTKKQHVIK